MLAQDNKIRVIAFGAHPDDCDIRAAGTAALFAQMGHLVKFVSVTNGDAGHQTEGGGALAKRRRLEAKESARRLGPLARPRGGLSFGMDVGPLRNRRQLWCRRTGRGQLAGWRSCRSCIAPRGSPGRR